MIKTLELKNFQSHKHSLLHFSPGVNIIKGSSHSGKTVIIRALKWALLNKPRGESFKSWFAAKNEQVSVGIQFENGFVVRERSSDSNSYLIPGDKLEALGAEVPDRVSEITMMDDINIHSQFDGFFMLQETPGNVARALNEKVGLNIIDEVLRKASNRITKTNQEIQFTEGEIVTLKADIEKLKYLEKAEKLISKMTEEIDTKTKIEKREKAISEILVSAKKLRESIEAYADWLQIEKRYNVLSKIATEFKSVSAKVENLSSLSRSILTEKSTIKILDQVTSKEAKTLELIGISTQIKNIESLDKNLSIRSQNITRLRNAIQVAKTEATRLDSEYHETLTEAGICPLCGQEIKK